VGWKGEQPKHLLLIPSWTGSAPRPAEESSRIVASSTACSDTTPSAQRRKTRRRVRLDHGDQAGVF
jgi:hypothetical protein